MLFLAHVAAEVIGKLNPATKGDRRPVAVVNNRVIPIRRDPVDAGATAARGRVISMPRRPERTKQ